MLRYAGFIILSLCSAGWCSVRCLGPQTVPYTHCQLYMCTIATDEDKSYVCLILHMLNVWCVSIADFTGLVITCLTGGFTCNLMHFDNFCGIFVRLILRDILPDIGECYFLVLFLILNVKQSTKKAGKLTITGLCYRKNSIVICRIV